MLNKPAASARDHAVHAALRDQLVAILPPAARIRAHGWRPWASASFAGARHWFDVHPASEALSPLHLSAFAEREWEVSGSFVADVALIPVEPYTDGLRVELLTVDD